MYTFGSDNQQMEGLGVSLGPSTASHPTDIKFTGRRCQMCHLAGLERAGGDTEWKMV